MKDTTTYALGDAFVALKDSAVVPTAAQIAVVPGAQVPVLRLDLPPGLRGQAREQVARRQLLDRAGLDAARVEMRPIYAPKEGDSWSKVLVADANDLAAWKQSAGQCRALLPDYLALPTSKDIWTVAPDGDDVLARLGPDDGFSAQGDLALTMLDMLLHEAPQPPRALLHLGDASEALIELAENYDVPLITAPDQAKALKLAEPRVLAHGELDFDLRRDPQMARVRLRKRVLPWRWPVLFGLVAAGLWSATQVIETQRITDQTAAMNANTRALVRQHFVPDGPLLDMRIQVSQVLAERRLGAEAWNETIAALDLFATAAGVLSTQNSVTDEVSTVSETEVALRLTVPDFATVDRIADALREAGLAVDVVESRVSDGSAEVRTEMRLTQPAEEARQ